MEAPTMSGDFLTKKSKQTVHLLIVPAKRRVKCQDAPIFLRNIPVEVRSTLFLDLPGHLFSMEGNPDVFRTQRTYVAREMDQAV